MLTAERRRLPGCSPVSPVPVGPRTGGFEKECVGSVSHDYPNVTPRCHHCVHCPWKIVSDVRKGRGMGTPTFIEGDVKCAITKR